MLQTLINLRDIHMIGQDCREWIIGQERFPQLINHHILCIGDSTLLPPYNIAKRCPPFSLIVACYEGCGLFHDLKEKRTIEWGPNQVLICPKGSPCSYGMRDSEKKPWKLAWVLYVDPETVPITNFKDARLINSECEAFVKTIQLLNTESTSSADSEAIQSLISLTHHYMRQLCGTTGIDNRLTRLWKRVEGNLNYPWTNAEIAREANLSIEHLRRLCLKHHGRSPMKHLHHLRMLQACTWLKSGNWTIESIAYRLGFSTVYSFSNSFKRWSSVSPGEFRKKNSYISGAVSDS